MSGAWTIRQMRREDIDPVQLLARDEPTAPHWPPFEYLRMLRVIAEEPARRGAWVAVPASLPAKFVAGFAMASHVAGICELEAVVVAPEYRRTGVATRLVATATGWARSLGAKRVQLEVRPSNEAALRLYLRLGFVLDGRRAGYYQNPPEDAALMGLTLP